MPGLDGFDLMRELRAKRGTDVPALALSAYAMDTDTKRALAVGYRMHLSKPLDARTLAEAVGRLARGT